MEGSTQLQDGTPPEQRSPDQTAAMEAACEAGTLPEEDRRANAGAEGPEDEGELARRAAEDQARLEALGEEERSNAPGGAFIDTATLGAVHQFLATLSGPEATRAAALRAQLPAVLE